MRKINKTAEPREWAVYRSTPGATYEAKPELRDSLLKEQGYLCAYCMRIIPVKDKNSNETSRIDHILSRTHHRELELDYQNMVICCPGAINTHFHCDKQKGEEDITFNLFDNIFIPTLSYKTKDGTISSSNTTYNSEIKNILNLNHPLLKKNRQQTILGVIQFLDRKKKRWKKSEILKYLTDCNTKDEEGKFKPDCGIIIWYLNKKIAQIADSLIK